MSSRSRRAGKRIVTGPPQWGTPTPQELSGSVDVQDEVQPIALADYDPEDFLPPVGEVPPDSFVDAMGRQRATRTPRDYWDAGPHVHEWIDERVLSSTWVNRFCTGCSATESYDDRRHPNPELCPVDCD